MKIIGKSVVAAAMAAVAAVPASVRMAPASWAAAPRQEEPAGHATAAPVKGTVIKGRAPVSKEILQVTFPRPKQYTLSNGLRVLVLEDHRLPAVHATILIKAGSIYESKKGVASLTGSMLKEGTILHSKAEIDSEVQEMGATLDAGAGEQLATVSVAGLSDQTEKITDLLADVLLHPAFPEDRFARLKSQRIEALTRERTDPTSLANELQSRLLYGGTGYVRIPSTPDQVRAISRDDLLAWYGQMYRPNHALIGVTGDVDGDQFASRLERLFAGWKPGGMDPKLPPADGIAPKTGTRVYIIDRPGSKQTLLDFVNIAIARTDPDYPALVVANHILGGGGTGYLFQNLRESKGYTYGAYSTLSAQQWPGVWGAYASVRNAVTGPATAEFFKEFAHMQNAPPNAVDLADAKRAIIGSFARTLESTDGILGRALEIEQYNLPSNYWEEYARRIQTVTPRDIQRVSRKYLGENRVQVIAVGERATIEEVMKPYGPISVYDRSFHEITAMAASSAGKDGPAAVTPPAAN